MPLVTSKEALGGSEERSGYAIGAFNVFNLESVKAVIAAAEAERSPAILQVWSGLDNLSGWMFWLRSCAASRKSVRSGRAASRPRDVR